MASQPIYQFYAELLDYKPKIWRRFQVSNNVTMAKLGYILMSMFEMRASHLFCFDVPFEENFQVRVGEYVDNELNQKVIKLSREDGYKATRIEISSDEEFQDDDFRYLSATEMKLKGVFDCEGEKANFNYDYGDDWNIQLVLEKIIIDKDLPGKELPRVIKGAGYGIIEDCGGTAGLEYVAKAFKKKKGTAYKEFCEWLGKTDLDMQSFDIEDANLRIKKVPRIYADIYEFNKYPSQASVNFLERTYKEPKIKRGWYRDV